MAKSKVSAEQQQVKQLRHERDLLADALGRVLVASGATEDQPLTGPQLLLLADDYIAHLTWKRRG